MKISYSKYKLMLLRPAIYNGEEFELDVQFNKDSLYRTDFAIAEALNMKHGDTASIHGKACFDNEDSSYDYIKVYMSESVLTKFIERYGFNKINATVSIKAKFVYAVYNSDEFYDEGKKEEIIACKLLEILSHQDEMSIDESNKSPEMRDYFADGMK